MEFQAEEQGDSGRSVRQYLKNVRVRKSDNTSKKYQRVISVFLKSCQKEFVEQVDRLDVMDFMDELHEDGNGGRTIENKMRKTGIAGTRQAYRRRRTC